MELPAHTLGKRPRCCRDCVFANPLQYDRRILRVCVNTPKAQGMLAIVDPSGVCPRFREPPAEVVRGIPPECEDKGVRYISLTKGQFAIVDAADFEWLKEYRWHITCSGGVYYAGRKEHGSSIRMHREIMRPPEGMVVHHVNGNGLNNFREAEYVTEMARRIAALILMQAELDANYEAVKADTWPWPDGKKK